MSKHFEIIDNKIAEIDKLHPYHNTKDKTIFIKQLEKDLKLLNQVEKVGPKNNIFKIKYNENEYNIFIEAPDGGGRDKTAKNPAKKISIPFTNQEFCNILDNKSIMVINLYVPLKFINNEYILDTENRVYLIVKPNTILSSNSRESKNPSSRWALLEEIQDVINKKNDILKYKENKKGNVYIVSWQKIKLFFNKIAIPEYESILKQQIAISEYESILKQISTDDLFDLTSINSNKDLSEPFKKAIVNVRKFQSQFRKEVFKINKNNICVVCNINIKEVLDACHILDVKFSDKVECQDKFNGLIMCKNHHYLFDNNYFLITEDGEIKINYPSITHDTLKIIKKFINLKPQQIKYITKKNQFNKNK